MNINLGKVIRAINPDSRFTYDNEDYSTLKWASPEIEIPTEEEINAKIQELQAAEPLRLLRIERDRLLQECDWRDLPSYPGTDQEEWRTYRQALRDLPNNSEPQLNDAGELINIVWPEKPNGGA